MDIVFVHGGGQGGWTWNQTIAAMELQEPGAHRLIAVDVPGCGSKRTRETDAIAFPEIIDELLAELDAAGVTRAVLVGHSQAGTIIPAMIARRPGLCRLAIHVSCVAPVSGMTVLETAKALQSAPEAPLYSVFGNPQVPQREQYRGMFCDDMGPAQAEAFLDLLGQDTWPLSSAAWTDWTYDHLAAVPSTYVLCLEDRILPPEAQEAFAVRLHCGRVVRIDAGHQVQNTRPQALAEILRLEVNPPA